ncbi:protein TIFY 9-like isoform X2 [Panicum virgatum]|uniref:protein TIFY 9-like isoform X2 n=1 Tax=Panicum virgatum TaxID=38727 RepID=UPI0019D5780D|nr:protein TIFY 9-like isoform X2 [Panicum virgatum]
MDMAKNGRPSAEHTPVRAPNSPSSPQVLAAGSSPPPPRTKMGSSSGDFFLASSANARTTATKPLTMFYNGGVAVFHLPQDKAEDLMKMAAAEGGGDGRPGPLRPNHGEELLSKMRQEMPIASKRSLQRFFQKRKERMFRP